MRDTFAIPHNAAAGSASPQPAAKKRYVQHVSGNGSKWEVMEGVTTNMAPSWMVEGLYGDYFLLPKSEYVLCKPVKVWRDVTAECEVLDGGRVYRGSRAISDLAHGYRIRKVVKRELKDGVLQDYAALIIEHEEEA